MITGELKSKVDGTVGNDMRAILILSRLEERIDIGHEAGRGVAGAAGKLFDSVLFYPDMVEPLAAYFFTGAEAHCFLNIITVAVGIESIKPDENGILVLYLELRLAVDRP